MTRLEHAFATRPCLGESKSGDVGVVVGDIAAIIDGLGHGPSAHGVASKAADFIRGSSTTDVGQLLTLLGEHLEGSIGAAVGVCHIDRETGVLRYASVGNTLLRRFGSESQRLVSQDGIVGIRMRTPRVQQMVLRNGDVVLLHTDGVSARFELDDYPEILRHSPDTVVRVVIRRFGKQQDDAGCIALRYRA